MSERTDYYAEAFFQVIAAEGRVNEVQDELFRFSRVLESHDELREALTDPHLPVSRRQQIVEDLLQDKATDATLALVSLVVGLGRIRDLSAIVDKLLARTAELSAKTVAEVRSAVELTEDQKQRLVAALKRSTGRDVEVVVIVDPTVMGGLVTQIGDTVIDGSVRHRLAQLRESF